MLNRSEKLSRKPATAVEDYPITSITPAHMCKPSRATEEEAAGAGFCGDWGSYNLTDLWDTNCLARQ